MEHTNEMNFYKDYIWEYLKEVKEISRLIDQESIAQLAEHLHALRKHGGRLFIIGIGGSAANASHAVSDFRKICGIEAYAPTDNVAELTAWTNDDSFDVIFSKWLQCSKLGSKDAVLVLSVGGGSDTTSKNIKRALDLTKDAGAMAFGIVSRDGGATKKMGDAVVLVPFVNEKRITPHAEEWQAVLWHLITNALASYPARQ